MTHGLLSWKRVVALVVALLVIAGLIVSSLVLDNRTDRRRPMYRAMIVVESLQYDLLKAGEPAQYGKLKHKGPAHVINGHTIKIPKGVIVNVALRGGKTCVHARNQHGDQTSWQCVDITAARPSLGGLQ
jgi:hypothetical protein